MPVEQAVTGAAEGAGRSIREELLAAQEEVNERFEKEAPEPAEKAGKETAAEPADKGDGRVRDASGRFAPADDKESAPAQEPARSISPEPAAATPAPVQTEFTPAPQAWTNEEKALWGKIPQDAQQAIMRREQNFHRAITVQDEDRNLGREFKRLSQPYEAMFASVGANPVQGFNDYLRIAYVLNTADPATKMQALQQVASRHGINLGEAQPNSEGQPALSPQLMQKISQLEAFQQQQARDLNAWRSQQQQAEMATTMSEIEVFSKDPAHPYFESVRESMATLINAHVATSLQDAYDQAVWARPDIREKLIAAQAAPQLREQQSRAKTERARAKAGSVRGGSGGVPEVARNPNASVREDLEAAFSEVRSRI